MPNNQYNPNKFHDKYYERVVRTYLISAYLLAVKIKFKNIKFF